MRKVELLAWAALLMPLSIGAGRADDRGAANNTDVTHAIAPVGRTDTARDFYWAVAKRLEAHKAYPVEAREKKLQGVAEVAFEIDRNGKLVSSRLLRSSGSDILDQEALAMIDRSQPFPAPPEGVGGKTVQFSLPVRFNVWDGPK